MLQHNVFGEPELRKGGAVAMLRSMSNTEANKKNAIAYYTKAFTEHKPEEAVAAYLGDKYIQHNPQAADGKQAFIDFVNGFVKSNPGLRIEVKRALADGDLVMTHVHIITGDRDPGFAAMDIFRFENGKIVEHWDVVQPVPATSANSNGMF